MGQDSGEQTGPDPQEQNPQETSSQDDGNRPDDQAAELSQQETNSSTTGNYEADQEDRVQKSPGRSNEQHPVPQVEYSNRRHLYAHNPPISNDEFAEALHAFNNSITNAETGERDSLAAHQRPRTPPIERARRHMQSLEEQGVQFTDDLEKEIIDNMIHSMGLVPALTEWCENEENIRVEYANKLLKEIDQLKLAMAKQQRDSLEKLASQTKSIEDYQSQKKGRKLDKQMEEIEKEDANDKLEGLDDSSILSSRPSLEIPRTPPGTEGLTPASSRSTLVEMGESKRLRQQVSDLQQRLDEARKDNERLQESNGSVSDKDSTNSWPEKGDKINTLEKENEDLKVKLEGQMKEMNELHQKIAKLQQTGGHQDQSEDMEASDTDSESSSAERIEDLEQQLKDQQKEIDKNGQLTRRIAELQINVRHFDRQAQLQRNLLEESEASSKKAASSFAEEIKGLKEKLAEKTQDQKRETNKNEALTRSIAELQINARHFDRKAQAQRNRLEELERVNFTTADKLVEALSSEKEAFNVRNGMSLVDKINYMNIATFFRTCNYVQLAIRENCLPIANVLMNDAEEWFKFCQEDLATMEPSVRIQMQASMQVLNGARRALIHRDQEKTKAGRESAIRGRDGLEKYPEDPAFDQLRRLANTVIKSTSDEQHLVKKVLQRTHYGRKRVRDQIWNDPDMKESEPRRLGLHSPLSPSKWNTGNLNKDNTTGENNEGN
ncbi:hypothetical protein NW752_000959 [Fusarium irregulare]|uniref:Uncharacterized protein n=1 Tax=Fusarium irregulare TaxID=2494466 RepID=A0A9W8PH79_9HYPO|nr:hypothetical protein NW766_010281 [Fusarium irregulare]KAJ4028697.1 hypothetical protein NW752_000959 [Fusarium irregulare]